MDALALRVPALQTAPSVLPQPLSGVAVDTVRPPRPVPLRWSLAALAGPGITHRVLGAQGLPGRGVTELERPAVGYAAQVQLGYAATPRLRLSGGVGYTEYATRLNAVVNKSGYVSRTLRFMDVDGVWRDSLLLVPDSLAAGGTQRLNRRNTYRYFAVPLQAQYRLGTSGRLAYDVVAGATLGIYLGGRTTSGSPCNCEQTTWRGAAGSPFRPFSFTLTAGANVEYEWRAGWYWQLQPVLHYGLKSLTVPGETARYPAALLFQAGLRIDLP
ncbi:hypothetical protein GCM10027048_15560 [Hymenobacter coalescens]